MEKETAEGTVVKHPPQELRGEFHGHEAPSDQMPRQEMAGSESQTSPHEMAISPTYGREILEKDGRAVVELDASGTPSNR